MKKTLLGFLVMGGIGLTQPGLAGDKNTQVTLYDKPDTHSTVVTQLTPNTPMVPFYKSDGWIKVGLPKDGQTGWVNLQQYSQARENFYHPNFQTLFVQVKGEDGNKPEHIVVYKNGKKLNDKEAAALYQQSFDNWGFMPPVIIMQNPESEQKPKAEQTTPVTQPPAEAPKSK